MLDQSGTNRIAKHIAESREQMAVLLNRKTFESTLPDMAMTSVMLVIPPDMARHPPLHEGTQRHFGHRLDDEMKVVRHQAHTEHVHLEFLLGGSKQLQEGSVVPIFAKDGRPTVPPIQNMIGVSADEAAWNPRHGMIRYPNV